MQHRNSYSQDQRSFPLCVLGLSSQDGLEESIVMNRPLLCQLCERGLVSAGTGNDLFHIIGQYPFCYPAHIICCPVQCGYQVFHTGRLQWIIVCQGAIGQAAGQDGAGDILSGDSIYITQWCAGKIYLKGIAGLMAQDRTGITLLSIPSQVFTKLRVTVAGRVFCQMFFPQSFAGHPLAINQIILIAFSLP